MTARETILGNAAKKILFITVTTGEGVANLPPILELAQKNDCVLWLDTPRAKREGWGAGPADVIEKRNRGILQSRVEIEEVPSAVVAALRDELPAYAADQWHYVLVENGGTKPISGAIAAWLAAKQPGHHGVIYGQAPTAELWLQPEGAAGRLARASYERSKLTLFEVLESYGYKERGDTNPNKKVIRLWPNPERLDEFDGYGRDADKTAAAHRDEHRWGAVKKARTDDYARFDAIKLLEPRKVANLEKTFVESDFEKLFDCVTNVSIDAMVRAKLATFQTAKNAYQNEISNLDSKRGLFGLPSVFNGILSIAFDAAGPTLRASAGIRPADGSLGNRFELAVARRVKDWAQSNATRFPISEVWWRVKVARIRNPDGKHSGEFDIVFVMANGSLFSLECKSFLEPETQGLSNAKDFAARLFNLQASGSRLAKMAVCAPIYTKFQAEDWFVDLHKDVRDFIERQDTFKFIGFTLDGQPTEYTVPYRIGDGKIENRPFDIQKFEDALEKLLGAYAPD